MTRSSGRVRPALCRVQYCCCDPAPLPVVVGGACLLFFFADFVRFAVLGCIADFCVAFLVPRTPGRSGLRSAEVWSEVPVGRSVPGGTCATDTVAAPSSADAPMSAAMYGFMADPLSWPP